MQCQGMVAEKPAIKGINNFYWLGSDLLVTDIPFQTLPSCA
jgi:hypothetical protein